MWGTPYSFGDESRGLPLSEDISYRQHIKLEYGMASGVMLSLANPLPDSGNIDVVIKSSDHVIGHGRGAFVDVVITGDIFIPFQDVRQAGNSVADITITTRETSQRAYLRYQIDSTKYRDGKLTRIFHNPATEKDIQGNVAFTIKYRPTAIEVTPIPWLILISGIVVAAAMQFLWFFRKTRSDSFVLRWTRADALSVLFVAGVVGLVYGIFWLSTFNQILLAGDMTKDILYLESAKQAIMSFQVPYWHHLTCGGQPLLGNIESNTQNLIMIPLTLLFSAITAMKLGLWIEVMIGGVGFYVLARVLSLSWKGALLPAIYLSFHSFISNRIVLGHTMFIAGFTWMPWVLIGLLLSLRNWRWGIFSSLALSAMLGAGDTHVLLYTLMFCALWAIILSWHQRRFLPLISFISIVGLFSLLSFYKIVPSFVDLQHFHSNLPKMVSLLISEGYLDDVFLNGKNVVPGIKLLHGEIEGWDNIGLYTGIEIIILGVIGLYFAPVKNKYLLGIPLILFFAMGEGTMYELLIRKIPLLGSILHIPSRMLLMSVISIALLAGFFIDALFKKGKPVLNAIAIVLISTTIYTMASYTVTKLKSIETIALTATDSIQHSIFAPREGLLAPHVCPDFNAPPAFISRYSGNVPLEVRDDMGQILNVDVKPNTIIIHNPPLGIFTVYSSASTIAQIHNGELQTQAGASKDGSMAIKATDLTRDVVITYKDPTAYGAFIISASALIFSVLLLITRRSTPTVKEGRST